MKLTYTSTWPVYLKMYYITMNPSLTICRRTISIFPHQIRFIGMARLNRDTQKFLQSQAPRGHLKTM